MNSEEVGMHISIDDVVRRKTGGPNMTVTATGTNGRGEPTVWVCWIENNKKVRDVCKLEELERVEFT